MDRAIAECVGLWLAEGDNKTKREITLTNNEFLIIAFFHNTLKKLFDLENKVPRLYAYFPDGKKPVSLDNCKVNYYFDVRANKPYYIYRICSVSLTKRWHKTVENIKQNKLFYADILRGFFAGEGNVKLSKKSYAIRIAQKNPVPWLVDILNYFKIKFIFKRREFVIWGRQQLELLHNLGIADLHPAKKAKLDLLISKYKEYHFSPHYLKAKVYESLKTPQRNINLAKKFNRSTDRLLEVLQELKKENRVDYFQIKNQAHWIRKDQNKVLISKREKEVLDLAAFKNPCKIAKELNTKKHRVIKIINKLTNYGLLIQSSETVENTNKDHEVISC